MNSRIKKYIFDIKTISTKRKIDGFLSVPNGSIHSQDMEINNFDKRKKLIDFAYRSTQFYKKKYDNCGVNVENIKTEQEFNRLPIVKRDEIKENFHDMVAKDLREKHYYKATTGGSTGTPITVLHDKRYPLAGIQWRVLEWWGVNPYENAAYVYRLRRTGIKKLANDILWWPTRRVFLDASEMDSSNILQFVKRYNEIKPSLLQGYVGGVYELALFLKDKNITIVPPKAVWVTSAPLTAMQRNIMQDVFKAPVYDQYGTCEIMWLAAECKQQLGLHMISDIRHIEFVDDDNMPVPANTWGRILLTDLQNYAFPLIRYEIGDIGRSLDFNCKCGLKYPLMDNVKGRQSDVIKTPSGVIISGEFLTTIFDDYPNVVREFQIYQSNDYSVKLSYIPNEHHYDENIINYVVSNLKKKSKNQLQISAEKVDKISHFKGKTKFVISDIN